MCHGQLVEESKQLGSVVPKMVVFGCSPRTMLQMGRRLNPETCRERMVFKFFFFFFFFRSFPDLELC